jgi:EAL domain-containing protein (putative c-di-GMP-specific phosphodiesterase class I)
MVTTAEGVETQDQLAQLRLEGCTEVQGYLFGRPTSAKSARLMLVEQNGSNSGVVQNRPFLGYDWAVETVDG